MQAKCIEHAPVSKVKYLDKKRKLGSRMISIVIPLYNEEENVDELYEQLKETLDPLSEKYEMICIDDGSSDNTFKKLINIHNKDDKLKIIKFRKNFGQTAAFHAGFDYAVGNLVVTLDGDLQNDPRDIPQMISKLVEEDYDVVCGWRFDRKDPIFKKFFSRFANFLRNNFTGETIHDSGCTLRVYKSDCIKDIDLYGEMHRFIPAMLAWRGFKVGETKVRHHERKHGKTKYDWKRIIKGFLDLIVITFWQKYSFRPVHAFGVIGMILMVLGGMISAYLVLQKLFFGISLQDRPIFIVSIMLAMIGIQFVTFGILADIMIKIYFSQNNRKNYLIESIL